MHFLNNYILLIIKIIGNKNRANENGLYITISTTHKGNDSKLHESLKLFNPYSANVENMVSSY